MKTLKTYFPIIITIFFVIIFSLNSEIVATSVQESLKLCYASVIPALLPFFILCDFLIRLSEGISISNNIMAFISSLATGFPTGVKNVSELYKDGAIDRKSAVALLHCSANASPAYVVSFIGVCIIKNKNAGIILLISQCLCALVCALFFKCFKKQNKRIGKPVKLTSAACFAITESVSSCLFVCGYIIFFGIIADIVTYSGLLAKASWQTKAVIIGCIEISRGLSFIDFKSKSAIVVAAVLLAFSGISVIMQCINCAVKAGLPSKPIIFGKLVYTLLMPGVAYLLFSFQSYLYDVFLVVLILLAAFLIYNIFDKSKNRLYNK